VGALCVLTGVPVSAAAEPVVEASVEWRTVDSELAAYGWVMSVRPTNGGADVSVEAREVLVGTSRRALRVRWPEPPPFEVGDEVLVFVVRGDGGAFVLRTPDAPARAYYALSGLASSPAVSFDGAVLDERESLFEAVRARAARGRPSLRASRRPVSEAEPAAEAGTFEVPEGSEAHRVLGRGGTVELVVPADQLEEGRTLALDREEAARTLAGARRDLSRLALGLALLAPLLVFFFGPRLGRALA
jgi:hypothetical protein